MHSGLDAVWRLWWLVAGWRMRSVVSSSRQAVRPRLLLTPSEHGAPSLNIYLTTYKVGDIVDIVANSYQQKGMPHKCEYQATTQPPPTKPPPDFFFTFPLLLSTFSSALTHSLPWQNWDRVQCSSFVHAMRAEVVKKRSC